MSEAERIRSATERLDELLRHGGVPPASKGARPSTGAGSDDGEPGQNRGAILVVDDNEDSRDMLARRLRRAALETLAARPLDARGDDA